MDDEREEKLFTVMARSLYANYTMTMVEAGIHMFMALYGLSVFLETPEHLRQGRKRFIVTSFVITCLSILTASLDVADNFQSLFRSTSAAHWSRLVGANERKWKALLSSTGLAVLIWIGDILLVYRCYIFCAEFWWVAILPGAASSCALVFSLLSTHLVDIDLNRGTAYVSAHILLTVATNIIVTSLIIFRILRARRDLSKVLPSQDFRLYTGVVAILIESALPLTVFGIIAAAFDQVLQASLAEQNNGALVSYYVFNGLFYSFCSLSPHMIIFRVTTGRSFTQFPTVKNGVISNSIRFAVQPAESSFLQSSTNRELGGGGEFDSDGTTPVIHITERDRKVGT